jgi:two-component system, NarL family, sensor kinase
MTLPPITDSTQSGTLLQGERHVLELIATGACLPDVLAALCRVIDEESGLMSSVYLLDRDGRQMTWAAGPNVPEAWQAATKVFAATPTFGTCGAAVSRREPVAVADIAASPLFAQWRDVARAEHLVGAWSTPFFSKDGDVLGTFAMLSREAVRPDAAQRSLVDHATHLASIAVERQQTEAGLRESERRFSTAFYSSPGVLSIVRVADGRFLYVNDRFVSVLGYARAEVVGQTALSLGLYADPAQRTDVGRLLNEHRAHDLEMKARTKSGATVDLLMWMDRIEILGEECVLAVCCDITARKQAEQALAQSERLLRTVLDALPVGVAVVDEGGNILLSNPASQRIWGGLIQSGPERYARSNAWWHDTGKKVGPNEWASVRARVNGETSVNELVDIEAFDGVRKVIQNSAVPIRDTSDGITGAVIVNEDVSARMTAEHERKDALTQLRTLTGRLMRAQDDERRRIAQLLHETTAQDLAALKMHLARLVRTDAGLSGADRAALTESIELAERSMSGIRTLSYLLHPPFLDEAGLLSALRWYAAGFAKRSGMKVDLDLPSTFERLPQDVETTLFRVVQEALINIHHHADSPTALIRLRVEDHRLLLEIVDRGRGMPSTTIEQLPAGGGALGVGVAGMRERLQQIGGTFDIESSDRGTTVRAQVSLSRDVE